MSIEGLSLVYEIRRLGELNALKIVNPETKREFFRAFCTKN
jgi:hypothetical protein